MKSILLYICLVSFNLLIVKLDINNVLLYFNRFVDNQLVITKGPIRIQTNTVDYNDLDLTEDELIGAGFAIGCVVKWTSSLDFVTLDPPLDCGPFQFIHV